MPDPGPRGHRGHGRHQHGPGFRPPWWPQGEAFPSTDRTAWHGMRRRFLRRVGLGLAVFFGLVFLANAAAVAILSRGEGRPKGFVPIAAFLGLGLLVAFAFVARAVRRMAAPIGELMEAADRVAGGDYAARVHERGPREMRRLARSFNAMIERLEANEEQRRNLLADLAHELRTPLSVIQGSTEGILDGLYAADRRHLEPVLETTKVMARLLDDLQTLSTADAGALKLYTEPVDPAELVDDALAAFGSQAAAADIALERRLGPGLPPAIEADPVRVGEVLANLLSNAVRHTPAGGSVTVGAEPTGDGVAFTVTDTGPGIAPEELPHLFDRFVKSKDSGGAGLGLAIARSLVEAHGGTIEATSERGRGATMRFVLPIVRQDGAG